MRHLWNLIRHVSWMNNSKPPPWPCGRSLRRVEKWWSFGVEEWDDSFDSWIAATFTSYFSINTPISVSLLPMPFTLYCRMLNDLPELLWWEAGGDGSCFSCCGGATQVEHCQSVLYSSDFFSPKHFACTQSGDVELAYWAAVLLRESWVGVHITCESHEQK